MPESNRINLIEPNGTKSDLDVNNGRTAAQKRKKEEDDEMRNFDAQNKRGVSLEMKLHIANLELKHESIHQQKKDRTVLALTTKLQMVQSNIERTEKRATHFSKEYDADDPLWKQVAKYKCQAEEIEHQLSELANYSPPPKRTNVISSPEPISSKKKTLNTTLPPVNEVSITITSAGAASYSSASGLHSAEQS